MINLLSYVKNVRTVYHRFYQKNVKEVEVQFQDDYPKGSAHLKLNSPISGLGDVFFAKNDCQEICANNSEVVNIQPESKMLILFPSYLKHEVSIHQIDKKRLSLAFNIMPVGRWGESDSSIDLSWL